MAKKDSHIALSSRAVEPVFPQDRSESQDKPSLAQEVNKLILNRYAPASVLINEDMEILHFRGQTSLYWAPAPGVASLHLLKMVRAELLLELRTAIHQARKENATVRKEGIPIEHRDKIQSVNKDAL